VQPIRNRQVIGSNPIGGSVENGFSFFKWAVQEGKTFMLSTNIHNQTILEFSHGDYDENYSRCGNRL
jgi:hypothetical protein